MKRIKKCLIFLFLIMIFIPFTKVDAKATCADVKAAVNELDQIDEDLTLLKCDDATTDKIMAQCNKLLVTKSSVLENIFEYNADKVCPSIKLNSIVSEYSGDCTLGFTSSVKEFADNVMKFFYITAPFILIIFGSLDFFKIVTVGNPEDIKKHRQNFIKRVIAFVLLYLTPFIVRSTFSIMAYDIDAADYVCAQEISFTPKITSAAVEGYYYEDSGGGSGDAGKRIAKAAKEIKEYAVENNFAWGNPGLPPNQIYTSKNKSKKILCALLIASSLYKSGVYDLKTAKKVQDSVAADVSQNLIDRGWKVIWNAKDLKPGDVLLYEKLNNFGGCHTVKIKGKKHYVFHVDIYYGNGKKVSTGDYPKMTKPIVKKFGSGSWTDKGTKERWLCGLRYQGK